LGLTAATAAPPMLLSLSHGFCSPVSGICRIHFLRSISPDEPSNVRSVKVRFAKADSGKRRVDRSQ
jgi:hypothetical protein